jgi:hypothetical protein
MLYSPITDSAVEEPTKKINRYINLKLLCWKVRFIIVQRGKKKRQADSNIFFLKVVVRMSTRFRQRSSAVSTVTCPQTATDHQCYSETRESSLRMLRVRGAFAWSLLSPFWVAWIAVRPQDASRCCNTQLLLSKLVHDWIFYLLSSSIKTTECLFIWIRWLLS